MKSYLGVKMLSAVSTTKREYCEYRGWTVPENEDPNEEGYLVEYAYDPNSKPNHPSHTGYISWSPKHVFEEAYRKTSALTFGLALEALKKGKAVARVGWNGKGMFLAYSPGAKALPAEKFWATKNREFAVANGGTADVLPCITMKTATGEILMGWLASQTDMLAEDWEIVS